MEKDKKILKESLDDQFIRQYCGQEIEIAIENILNKLEELEKENKELKDFIELEYEVCGGRTMYSRLMSLPKSQLVKTILRVRKSCKECSIRKTLDEYVTDSIPKSKIEDKIKELEKAMKEDEYEKLDTYIDLLKSLLEEK